MPTVGVEDSAPRIAIITPTRNRRPLLAEMVASLKQQSFQNWECIVIDDASQDDTWSWLQGIGDPRLRSIRLDRPRERAAARNTGLDQARAALLLFLDDDDRLPRQALDTHLSLLDQHPQAVASIGGYRMFDPSGSARRISVSRTVQLRPVWREVFFGWMAVFGQCLVRSQAVREAGGWEDEFIPIEDHALLLKIAQLGPVVLQPHIVLEYRVHPDQWRPTNLTQQMLRVRRRAAQELAEPRRSQAGRLLAAHQLARQANRHYWRAQAGPARRLYWRAMRTEPYLLRSPLTRPMLLHPMMKTLVGGAGLRRAGQIRRWLRRITGREIQRDIRLARAGSGATEPDKR